MSKDYLSGHELFLKQILAQTPIPAPAIRAAIEYALFSGGKRIRPLFVYLAGELLEVDLEVLDVIAAALELTHCYSLIHDDLPAMDNDDWRRGKPSCHKAFNEATAILVGDGMQALAFELLLNRLANKLSASKIICIAELLAKASGVSGMVSGQSLDLSELSQKDVPIDRLTEIHLLKTGRLISVCFEMPLACLDFVSETLSAALLTYARHMGLVFQMQDDYLDYYAPAHVSGKGRSSDLANQKTTFASLFSRAQLRDKVSTHYELAFKALADLGARAEPLKELTQSLYERL